MFGLRIALSLLLLVVASGCKTTGGNKGSDIQSLNNFRESEKGVICTATPSANYSERYDTYWEQKSIDADASYKERLKPVLASVPEGLQKWFFLKGGLLKYIGNAKEFCSTRKGTVVDVIDYKGEVGGCVHFEQNGDNIEMPKIYVGVTSGDYYTNLAELSNTVQGFSIVLASYASDIGGGTTPGADGTVRYEFGKSDAAMQEDKLALSFLFLDDLMNSMKRDQSLYVPEVYKTMIEDQAILDPNITRDERWKKVWAVRDSEKYQGFMNMIFAQTFDSANCSNETKALLEGEDPVFAQTGRWYKKNMEPELNAILADAPAEKPTASLTSTSSSYGFTADVVPDPDKVKPAFGLVGGRFPILRGVLRAPFAIGAYFVNNKPVRSWFAEHRPVRRFFAGILRGAGAVVRAGGAVLRRGARILFPGNRCWRIRRRLC